MVNVRIALKSELMSHLISFGWIHYLLHLHYDYPSLAVESGEVFVHAVASAAQVLVRQSKCKLIAGDTHLHPIRRQRKDSCCSPNNNLLPSLLTLLLLTLHILDENEMIPLNMPGLVDLLMEEEEGPTQQCAEGGTREVIATRSAAHVHRSRYTCCIAEKVAFA